MLKLCILSAISLFVMSCAPFDPPRSAGTLSVARRCQEAGWSLEVDSARLTHAFLFPGGALRLTSYPENDTKVVLSIENPALSGQNQACAQVGVKRADSSSSLHVMVKAKPESLTVLTRFDELADVTGTGAGLEICGQRFEFDPAAKSELSAYLREFRRRALPVKEWPTHARRPVVQTAGPIMATDL